MSVSRRIFLSYGHDEHAVLADRVKRDLEARGHEVWIDHERLLPGEDWEACIERGIDWASSEPARGRIVLLMTPHAVRRPDGYCLNEIARALGRGLTIVPIMAVWCEPPLSICRIQWLDLRDCLPLAKREGAYQGKLPRLVEALEADKLDFDGLQARLMAILDPLPFESEISQHVARFTGRAWMFEAIDAWLVDRGQERVFWIVGPPGIGKTAIAARLVASRPEVVAAHFCRFGHAQKADARRAIMSIAYQLATQLPDYQTRLNSLNLQQIVAESDARTLFDRLIVQPLSSGFADPGRILVILIDALDETTDNGRNALASFLAAEFARTPPWLRLIVTSRPDPEVMYPLQAITAHVLDASAPENAADMEVFLRRELKGHLRDVRNPDAVIGRIVERSEGSFLYIEWLRQEIVAGRMALADVDRFPRGLGGVYSQFADRQWPDIARFREEVAPGLDIVAAAQEPVGIQFVGDLLNWGPRRRNDFRIALGSLFAVADGAVSAFHKSLLDWLTDPTRAGPYLVSVTEGDERLAEAGWREAEGRGGLSPYLQRHLLRHLAGAGRWDRLETLLTRLAFLEGQVSARGVFALAADLAEVTIAMPAARPLRGLIRLLAEAVRRDLQFIARHPTTLFQCLWNQCWWYDVPDDIRAQQRERYPLRDLMEQWRAEKETAEPGFIWARSLRPPVVPLGASHIALVGHDDTVRTVALSADGSVVLSASSAYKDGVRVWSTATGEQRQMVKGDGAAAISSDGRRIATGAGLFDVATGRKLRDTPAFDARIVRVAFSPDGATVAYGLANGWIHVQEVTTGRAIAGWLGHPRKVDWGDSHVGALAFSPDGGTLASGGGWGCAHFDVILWDWREGSERCRYAAHPAQIQRIAFSPDGGRVASCSGHVGAWRIQLGHAASDQPPLWMTGHTAMVNDIGFSPDGLRLVSASDDRTVRLWDATLGTELRRAALPEEVCCAGFLPDGQRLYTAGDGRIVRIWDSFEAISRPPRPDQETSIWCMAFSPDGRVLATGTEGGEIALWDAATGVRRDGIRWSINGPVNNLAFSPDSRRLAAASGYAAWDFDEPWSGADDVAIRVFELAAGNRVAEMRGPMGKIRAGSLRYSEDGTFIVAPARDVKTVWVWDAATLERCRAFEGDKVESLPEALRVREPVPERMKVSRRNAETVVVDESTGKEIAWFALPFYEVTPHPGGRTWAGRSDDVHAHMNTARRLDLFDLEGRLPPETPRWKGSATRA